MLKVFLIAIFSLGYCATNNKKNPPLVINDATLASLVQNHRYPQIKKTDITQIYEVSYECIDKPGTCFLKIKAVEDASISPQLQKAFISSSIDHFKSLLLRQHIRDN